MNKTELERYQESQRAVLGEFLHELKTPLAIIRTHLESEFANEEIPLEVRKKMVMDVEEVARLTQLIGQMKTLLSCEFEDEKNHFRQESFLALLVDVIELLEPLALDKAQKISFVATENIEYLMHRDKCKQLFYNLLSNAIKYTPKGGSIEVTLTQSDNDIQIKVKDNGYGIVEAERKNIFKQFYRCENTHEEEGTGLGLALCQAIAKVHSAEIILESALDIGSTFSVIFPKKGL